MNYNEFAQKIKTKYPQYADMDDLELTQKMIAKYPEYKEQVVFDKVEKPQQTEYERIANDNSLTREQKEQAINDYFKKEQRDIQKERWGTHAKNFGGAGLEIGSALIPIGGGAKLATKLLPKAAPLVKNLASNVISGGVAGGVSGFGRGLRQDENLAKTTTQDAILGAGITSAMPFVGQGVKNIIENPKFQNAVGTSLEALTSVPKKFVDTALNRELAGQSIFKGQFDPEKAYVPIERKLREAKSMLPTKEQYSEQFNKIGQKAIQGLEDAKTKAGAEIQNVLENLPQNKIDISGLRNAVETEIKGFAKGGEFNPALEKAGREIQRVRELLNPELANAGNETIQKQILKNTAKDMQFEVPKNTVTRHAVKNNVFSRIYNTPEEQAFIDAYTEANNIIKEIGKNPEIITSPELMAQYENRLARYTSQLPDEAAANEVWSNYYNVVDKANDFNNAGDIIPIGKTELKPIDIHNIKENLYDTANYEIAGGIKNRALKGIANQFNNFLRRNSKEYAKVNDRYSLLRDVEKELGGNQGVSANTIGAKLQNIGSSGNLVSGLDSRLKNVDTLLDRQYKFYDEAKNLVDTVNKQDEMLRLIGSANYERNPRLLGNITDEARELALQDLQKQTGVNFMNQLDEIRAREALERFFPGQGGGSGSAQGFGNLLRTSIIGGAPTAAAITQNPLALAGLLSVSPKFAGQGTIKNLGSLYRLMDKVPPEWITSKIIPTINLTRD